METLAEIVRNCK